MFLSTANHFWGFPGGPVGKSPPCNARARSLVWEEPAGPGGAEPVRPESAVPQKSPHWDQSAAIRKRPACRNQRSLAGSNEGPVPPGSQQYFKRTKRFWNTSMESNAVWLLDEKRMNVVIRGFMDLIQTLPDFQSYFLIIQYQLFVASIFQP